MPKTSSELMKKREYHLSQAALLEEQIMEAQKKEYVEDLKKNDLASFTVLKKEFGSVEESHGICFHIEKTYKNYVLSSSEVIGHSIDVHIYTLNNYLTKVLRKELLSSHHEDEEIYVVKENTEKIYKSISKYFKSKGIDWVYSENSPILRLSAHNYDKGSIFLTYVQKNKVKVMRFSYENKYENITSHEVIKEL